MTSSTPGEIVTQNESIERAASIVVAPGPMLNDPVTMAWYAPGNWPELPRTAPMSLNEIGSVGTVAKKKRLNPARKSLTKWGDRTLVKPTFTNLWRELCKWKCSGGAEWTNCFVRRLEVPERQLVVRRYLMVRGNCKLVVLERAERGSV